jgi:hypothetical protein
LGDLPSLVLPADSTHGNLSGAVVVRQLCASQLPGETVSGGSGRE